MNHSPAQSHLENLAIVQRFDLPENVTFHLQRDQGVYTF